jgi:hypothetical protein
VEVKLHTFLTSALPHGGEQSPSYFGHFTLAAAGYELVCEGFKPVSKWWRREKSLPLLGIKPQSSSPKQSLYQLSYPYYSHTRAKFIAHGTKITLSLT